MASFVTILILLIEFLPLSTFSLTFMMDFNLKTLTFSTESNAHKYFS